MSENGPSQTTVRLPSETMEHLRSELSHFSTDSARFQFLVQFYFDYKEMGYPSSVTHITCEKCATNESNEDSDDEN